MSLPVNDAIRVRELLQSTLTISTKNLNEENQLLLVGFFAGAGLSTTPSKRPSRFSGARSSNSWLHNEIKFMDGGE